MNARVSEKSCRRYRLLRRIWPGFLSPIERFLVQAPEHLARLESLGVSRERAVVTGNLKLDNFEVGDAGAVRSEIRRSLGWAAEAPVLLAGSTHPGEEELIAGAFQIFENQIRVGDVAVINGTGGAVFERFVVALLLTATVVGGLAGWGLGGTSRAALAMALAGFVFALGPGHNVPFLGNTPAVGEGLVLHGALIVTAAVVLEEVVWWLAGLLARPIGELVSATEAVVE